MSFRPESENYKFWTKEEDEKLTKLVLDGTPIPEIARQMNRSYSSCASHSSLLGLYNRYLGPSRKYTVNEQFWDSPNNLNCYYAGLLAADGCIMLKNKRFKYTGSLRWELHYSDEILLQSFKRDTLFTGNINHCVRKGGFVHKSININCEQWNKDLIEKFNIVPKKTYRTCPPNNITEQQLFCWLIGYFDGDGMIRYDKFSNSVCLKIASCSQDLINFVHEFLKTKFTQRFRNKEFSVPRQSSGANAWEVSINGIRAVCLYSYLKQYNLPKLARKWDQPKINELEASFKESHPHFFDFSHLPPPA